MLLFLCPLSGLSFALLLILILSAFKTQYYLWNIMYNVFYVFMFYVGVSENVISFSYLVFLMCCGNDNKAPLNPWILENLPQPGKRSRVTPVPHVSVRTYSAAHLPRDGRPEKSNALQRTRLPWEIPCAVHEMWCVPLFAPWPQLLCSISQRPVGLFWTDRQTALWRGAC